MLLRGPVIRLRVKGAEYQSVGGLWYHAAPLSRPVDIAITYALFGHIIFWTTDGYGSEKVVLRSAR